MDTMDMFNMNTQQLNQQQNYQQDLYNQQAQMDLYNQQMQQNYQQQDLYNQQAQQNYQQNYQQNQQMQDAATAQYMELLAQYQRQMQAQQDVQRQPSAAEQQYQQNMQNMQNMQNVQNFQNAQNMQNAQQTDWRQNLRDQQSAPFGNMQEPEKPLFEKEKKKERPEVIMNLKEIYSGNAFMLFFITFFLYLAANVAGAVVTDSLFAVKVGSIIGVLILGLPELISMIQLRDYAAGGGRIETTPFTIRKVLAIIRTVCTAVIMALLAVVGIILVIGVRTLDLSSLLSQYNISASVVNLTSISTGAVGAIVAVILLIVFAVLWFYICILKNACALQNTVLEEDAIGRIRIYPVIIMILMTIIYIWGAAGYMMASLPVNAVIFLITAINTIFRIVITLKERGALRYS